MHVRSRKASDTKTGVLPDFFIGAQAQTERWTILTRNVARYTRIFQVCQRDVVCKVQGLVKLKAIHVLLRRGECKRRTSEPRGLVEQPIKEQLILNGNTTPNEQATVLKVKHFRPPVCANFRSMACLI